MKLERKEETDPRDRFLAAVVSGRSFAEVGGLWGTVNEKVSVAHRLGARSLTMIDAAPATDLGWAAFEQRRRELGVGAVTCVSSDVVRLVEAPDPPLFDVVHCSGVLYHVPEPMRLLLALKRIARHHLVLTSLVARSEYPHKGGTLRVPDAASLFIPALEGPEREAVAGYWKNLVGDGAVGLTRENPTWQLEDFGPWWWLPRPRALRALSRSAGFYLIEEREFWEGNACTLLLSARPAVP
ncbi:MAG: class I SAM-dependent methyltransferase [Methylacidiphilaceae bacterium]|nr:class I SAM-dependent methyltransferase [Candidatus Methylacidiphilaceae bacterium]